MKKIVSFFMALILFTSSASAEAIRTDDRTKFEQGIELVRQISDPQSLESAVDIFASITSGYNGANYFKMYAQALVDLYNGDYLSTLMRIEILEGNNSFTEILKQYSLPTCESIKKYTEGRQAEDEERYIDAYEQYSQTDIIDSLDRLFTLKPKMSKEKYDKANSLFEAGEFELAAELFTSLGNYSDSLERAKQAKEMILSQTNAIEIDEPSPESYQTTNAASVPWPIIEINRKAVEKTGAWDDSRVFGYFGPGREFLSVAYFRWSHINNPYSLFTLGEYTLIDFNYPTRPDWHGRISAFINSTSIVNRSGTIDMEELKLESYPATLLQKTTPRFGPSEEYALMSDDINIISSSVELESGSSVLVFFEANDWAYIEFTCQKKEDNKTITGTARGWIPNMCVNNSEDSR